MMKLSKLFTLLLVLSVCFTISAQQYEADPNKGPVNYTQPTEALWDLLLEFDAAALSGAAGNAGAEWDGTSFYSTRWASNLIHEYSADGTTLIREFSIPGVTGLRDLAFDGTYFYGGAAATTIYQMDFATKYTYWNNSHNRSSKTYCVRFRSRCFLGRKLDVRILYVLIEPVTNFKNSCRPSCNKQLWFLLR